MDEHSQFLQSLIDSLSDQIVVIDNTGEIVFVNHSWRTFGSKNGFPTKFSWLGENYLQVCRKSAVHGDHIAGDIVEKIERIIQGKNNECEVDYPCHTPKKQRWFLMRATLIRNTSRKLFLISHKDVTRRKLAEDQATRLSLEDPLTGIANRRKFDQMLKEEWRRRKRGGFPMSAIIIDIDYFKSYNDKFGHSEGDVCLRIVADTLSPFARRPGDIVARIGGEEFSIILSGMGKNDACKVAEAVRLQIESLSIDCGIKQKITISLGVVTVEPDWNGSVIDFIRIADEALYMAKNNGRNQVTQKIPASIT